MLAEAGDIARDSIFLILIKRRSVLFPVRLVSFEAIRHWELFDADEGKDLAAEIREYYIPDFSDWKNHDPYAEGLKNLLRDLKTEGPAAA